MIIHVLGSDIVHHNHTVLSFFHTDISTRCQPAQYQHFMVVSREGDALKEAYPLLDIAIFESKKSLAHAVVKKAKADRTQKFLLHGQFNPHLWLAILFGQILPTQLFWHIWGADLYEDARGWKYRLFYFLRRRAQKKIGYVFATRGDLAVLHESYPDLPSSLLYFPTKMGHQAAQVHQPHDVGCKTILLGNSGDKSNRHMEALNRLKTAFGDKVKIIIPMGYPAGNEAYIAQVQACADSLFTDGQVDILRDKIAFDDYLAVLKRCDASYFAFHRQQAIGTLCLLIELGVPFILNRENTFYVDLKFETLPVIFDDEPINAAVIEQSRRLLACVDKENIAFFYPNYVQGWLDALALIDEVE